MNVCEGCGAKTRKADVFCASCGAKLRDEKPGATQKKVSAQPKKKEKVELSDEVKQRLKRELEISIKAFKEGRISIDEFQNIKKGIVSKAKAGFYDQGHEQTGSELQPPRVSEGELPPQTPEAQKISRPVQSGRAPPFSNLWYLAPAIFNIFGGIVAYFAIRNQDVKSANKMLVIGGVSLIVVSGGLGYYLYSLNLLPFSDGGGASSEIVVDGAPPVEDTPVVDQGEVVLLNGSNSSAEKMNIKLADLGSEYYINSLLSGVLRDPLEFAGGNTTKADELSAAGWLENHRIVIKKDFQDLGKNITIIEKEIDSSISKYDANKTSKKYFELLLQKHRDALAAEGYSVDDFEIEDVGVIGKRVDVDPEFDIRVSYRVVFYKKDSFVNMSVSKIGRGLDEAEVKGYAELIEARIK